MVWHEQRSSLEAIKIMRLEVTNIKHNRAASTKEFLNSMTDTRSY